MCTILFAFKAHPKYDLIFLGNRDEFKNRPSLKVHFWESNPSILAGMDLEKGGTWTGITKSGRISFVTNYRNAMHSSLIKSRGYLTQHFLDTDATPLEYLEKIKLQRDQYGPFNLVVGTFKELWFYSNMEDKIFSLNPGVYGLSNAYLDTPWFKLKRAKNFFLNVLNTDFIVDDLFKILDDKVTPPDEELPNTGVSLEAERMLSSVYIDTPEYGTMFKTVILASSSGQVEFYEKSLDKKSNWSMTSFNFKCDLNRL
ncbi:hypothetical protein OXPF_08250 [Oxobacter pfennigii]|uniref:NRDE family protein n=1 Tax=Oxobacter pfennigii TaxID=36849 RepID=A0A0N8NTR8_9CLOT|nr:NRDE family protein [Oxobacter pfennigii]KPU45592.1 hypothetical protein OXPF_08250 [Oxobacter pfennigii]